MIAFHLQYFLAGVRGANGGGGHCFRALPLSFLSEAVRLRLPFSEIFPWGTREWWCQHFSASYWVSWGCSLFWRLCENPSPVFPPLPLVFFCRPWPAARGAAFGLAWFVPVCIVPLFFVAFSPFREFCRTIGEIFTFLQFRRCTIWGLRGRMAVVIHNYHPVWFQRSGHLKWWG